MDNTVGITLGVMILVVAGVAIIGGGGFSEDSSNTDLDSEFTTFDSQADFTNYTQRQDRRAAALIGVQRMGGSVDRVEASVSTGESASTDIAQSTTTATQPQQREISTRQTNVQETSVGEPDIVKVTPEATYYAQQRIRYDGVEPLPGPDIRGTPSAERTVQRVIAGDTTNKNTVKRPRSLPRIQQLTNPNTGTVSVTNELNITGKLLRSDTALVAYNNSVITGYELRDRGSEAQQTWSHKINDSHSVVTTRRVGSTAYFITQENTQSCPVHPVPEHGSITCSDVYHPETQIQSTDSVYTVFSMNMETGNVRDELSFVGSRDTTTYMTEDTVYVSYNVINFTANDVIDIVIEMNAIQPDSDVITDLRELQTLDVSDEAKMTELQNILEEYGYNHAGFNRNVRSAITNYTESNRRDIFKSSIVSLDVSNGAITPDKTGSVPGVPLNQFSFDEHNGELRVATTVSPMNQQQSKNDVYVLNEELEVTGSVQGMAEGQRIYAVRFMGDTGYVITYRQVDPLHVIDLRDSENPEEVGTVKLPGFSEYLHQVGDGKLLGVGESDGGNGKVVLFNVSEASDPQVSDSLVIDEWSTAVSESHHAFMTDGGLNHAYVPAGNSLYVVDYSNETVTRETVVNLESSVKRTRMYGDKMLAFSDTEIAVIDKPAYNVSKTITLYE